MALMGITRKRLDRLGCDSMCLMDSKETSNWPPKIVPPEVCAVDLALDIIGDGIYVIGQVHQPLVFRLIEHVKAGG